jgi:hypothetical protein
MYDVMSHINDKQKHWGASWKEMQQAVASAESEGVLQCVAMCCSWL